MVDDPLALVGVFVIGGGIAVALVLLLGLRLAMPGVEPARSRHRRVGTAVAIGLVVWFALDLALARAGAFATPSGWPVPPIALGIAVPLLLGLPVVLRSRRLGEALAAVPLSWLIGVQIYRVIGAVFLYLYVKSLLPGVFALPAGIGDVLVGLAALPVAYAVARRRQGARGLAIAWNIAGIGDLVVAVGTGFLSSPGPYQMLAFDAPNVVIGAYPLVMIPLFAVPVSILLHAAALRRLMGRAPVAAMA